MPYQECPFEISSRNILSSLLLKLLGSRLSSLEKKSQKELTAMEFTKKNINSTLQMVVSISSRLPKPMKKKPSFISKPTKPISRPRTPNYLCQSSKQPLSRPKTPLKKRSKIIIPKSPTPSMILGSKRPHYIPKTPSPVPRRRRKKERTFSGMIGDVSATDDEILTMINTDNFTRNSVLPSIVWFPLEKLFDKNYVLVKFLDTKDVLNYILINKILGKIFVLEMIRRIEENIEICTEEIRQEEEKSSYDIENFDPKKSKLEQKLPLILSVKSKKALELLNEKTYLEVFTEKNPPNANILPVFQILFQLMSKKGNRELSQIMLEANNKKVFWDRISRYILSRSKNNFGDFLSSEIENFDFSARNVSLVMRVAKPCLHLFTPSFFTKISSTTALVVFTLKDILDYIGLNPTIHVKKNKINKYIEGKEKMNKILNNFFLNK